MWSLFQKILTPFFRLFYSMSTVRHLLLSSIHTPFCHHHIALPFPLSTSRHSPYPLGEPACGEADHFQDGHDGPLYKKKRYNICLFVFHLVYPSYIYLLFVTNLFYCFSFPWTLLYSPIDVRLVLLHVTREKSLLHFWRFRWSFHNDLCYERFITSLFLVFSFFSHRSPPTMPIRTSSPSVLAPWPLSALLFLHFFCLGAVTLIGL